MLENTNFVTYFKLSDSDHTGKSGTRLIIVKHSNGYFNFLLHYFLLKPYLKLQKKYKVKIFFVDILQTMRHI